MSSENCNFDSISRYFHLPLVDAAERLGVCATILKKICRSFGIKRWPHRKIRSIDNTIQKLRDQIKNTDIEEEINNIKLEIESLQHKREAILINPNIPFHTENQKKIEDKKVVLDPTTNKNILEECYKIIQENYKKKITAENDRPSYHINQNNAIPTSAYHDIDQNVTIENLTSESKITGKKRGVYKPVVSIVVNTIPNYSNNNVPNFLFENNPNNAMYYYNQTHIMNLNDNQQLKKHCSNIPNQQKFAMATPLIPQNQFSHTMDYLPQLNHSLPSNIPTYEQILPSFSQFVRQISE